MTKPIEKDIVVDGHLIHYYHLAPTTEKKKTIVFLHGWGSNSALWFTSTLSFTDKGYELIYIDLPGFGKSQNPTRPFHLKDYTDVITQCLHKLDIVDPILVGHSFGGKIAVKVAAQKECTLSGLILVDASGLPHTSFVTQTKITIAKTVKPVMDLPFMQGIRSHLLRMSGSDDYIATPALRETFVNIISEHIEYDLPQITAKTLIVWGGNDENAYTPVSDVTVFHKLIPQAEVHIIEGAGHYCFLDAPHEFESTINEFVSSL